MDNLLSQNVDSIPFVLQTNIVTSLDSIPSNDFMSYEYLRLDSSKLFYDIDTISLEIFSYGMEGMVRPFIQQIGGVFFLVFTFLVVFSAFAFKNTGLEHFGNIRLMFSADSSNKKYNNNLLTTFDFWNSIFYVSQTFILFSILFTSFAVERSNLYISSYDYLMLFLQIFIGFCLFVLLKYILYVFIGSVFSKSNMNTLISTYLNTVYITGIISFIPVVIYIYIPESQLYVLFFLLSVFIIARIAVFIQAHVFFKKSHIGSFYFFVYLCGIEIVPYLLLYKAIILIN